MYFRNFLLPSLIFVPWVPTAWKLIFNDLTVSGAGKIFADQCPPNVGPYSTNYTNVTGLDQLLCMLTSFFHATFIPELIPLTTEFGSSLSVLVLLSFLEMSRAQRSWLFTFPIPVIFWLTCQLYGAGTCFPAFWLAMIVSGHATTQLHKRSTIDQAHADATFFALCGGFLIPSALMAVLEDPVVTMLWQFFPIWTAVLWAMHLLVRPSSRHGSNGQRMVYSGYLFTFAISFAAHTYAVWPLLTDHQEFARNFIPRLKYIPYDTLSTLSGAVNSFLQWDLVMTFGSSFLGTLWFANSLAEGVVIALWSVVGTIAVGPGAALSGTLLWREWKLNGEKW